MAVNDRFVAGTDDLLVFVGFEEGVVEVGVVDGGVLHRLNEDLDLVRSGAQVGEDVALNRASVQEDLYRAGSAASGVVEGNVEDRSR